MSLLALGNRLHRAVLATEAPVIDVIIPAAWLVKGLREVLPGKTQASVLEIADRKATIHGDTESRTAKLIEDKFPNASKLIADHDAPHDPDVEIAVNPRFFADVLKACELFAGDNRGAARFKVAEGFKPLRFDVHRNDDRFTGLLMPLRTTAA